MSVTDLVAPRLRRVRLAELSADERRAIVQRASTATPDLRDRVRAIVDRVRVGGDAAVHELGRMYGGGLPWDDWRPPSLLIPRAELIAARDALPRDLRAGLEAMAVNIERFHALSLIHI